MLQNKISECFIEMCSLSNEKNEYYLISIYAIIYNENREKYAKIMAFHQIEKLKPLPFRSKASLLLILFHNGCHPTLQRLQHPAQKNVHPQSYHPSHAARHNLKSQVDIQWTDSLHHEEMSPLQRMKRRQSMQGRKVGEHHNSFVDAFLNK